MTFDVKSYPEQKPVFKFDKILSWKKQQQYIDCAFSACEILSWKKSLKLA